MDANLYPIGSGIVWAITGSVIIFAARWPYSADAVRLDAIAMLDKVQVELQRALTTEDTKAMYRSLAVVAYMLGKISQMLKDVREK